MQVGGGGWKAKYDGESPKAPRPMPEALWKVLYHRGLQSDEQLNEHFSPTMKGLSSPWQLHDMDRAVDILIESLKNKNRVCIYADFDLDGTPGLALLYSGLENLGFKNLEYYQPRRLSEGYGVHTRVIEQLADNNVKTLLTVDVGITDVKAVARAKELGMKVVVTDHHLPKETLPAADAIVNPNKGFCESDMGHLCGTGVAFYLVLALRSKLRELGLLERDFDPKELLDCFAIGTITDMVPIVRENRILVKHGLVQLEKTNRPGLRALLKILDLWGRPLSSQDVGFRFAPKLNALSRMEEELLPIDIFMAEDDEKAQSLVDQVLQCHNKRVSIQKEAEKAAEKMRQEYPQEGFVWIWSDEFHQGVVGLVATKLAQKYGVPAFVGSGKEDGTIVGSARAFGDESVLQALENSSEALIKFGGHDPASGFELSKEQAETLDKCLAEYFCESSTRNAVVDQLYDVVGEADDLGPEFMSWYEAAGPYGQDFEPPVLLLEKLKVSKTRSLKGGHWKLSLRSPENHRPVEAMCFSPSSEQRRVVENLEPEHSVDVLAEPQWNYFMGNRSLQLLVKDIRRS